MCAPNATARLLVVLGVLLRTTGESESSCISYFFFLLVVALVLTKIGGVQWF